MCKNCASNYGSPYICDFVMNGTTEGCPCNECLVKMVCFESCKLFEDHYKSIFGFKPTKNKGI